jgi:hypothetical protein
MRLLWVFFLVGFSLIVSSFVDKLIGLFSKSLVVVVEKVDLIDTKALLASLTEVKNLLAVTWLIGIFVDDVLDVLGVLDVLDVLKVFDIEVVEPVFKIGITLGFVYE